MASGPEAGEASRVEPAWKVTLPVTEPRPPKPAPDWTVTAEPESEPLARSRPPPVTVVGPVCSEAPSASRRPVAPAGT